MTAGPFQRLPIRHKLVAMIMLTAVTVLALASAGYLITDYFRTRAAVLADLETQAGLALESSAITIEFLEEHSALDALRPLGSNPYLQVACLYRPDGRLFVQFPERPTGQACAPGVPPEGYTFHLNSLELVTSYHKDVKLTASLYLRSSLDMIWRQLRVQALIVLALLLLALAVGFVVSARLQAFVSEPIMALARTAAQVSSRGDYSLRAGRSTDDELGALVDAFNRMLDRIQLREQELSRANEDLRREVVERERAEQERGELLVREREANRLKDEFLATLSHELRTPLNAILGWTRLLRASAVPAAAVDRALEKVERNAHIQSRLVEDLLDVSRIASGKLHLEIRGIDLVTIVDRAIDSIRPTADARGVAIERRFTASSLVTAGDADRLQQVVWNLLSNAVKFSTSGGVVRISLDRQALFDELKVSDNGIGIDPEFLPNVFESFRQGDASSTRAHGGLGLGLAIVRHLAEMHGGAVEAESAGLDSGATFTVRLPVRQAEAADTAFVEEPDSGALSGRTILIADDDGDVREMLTGALESAGARVQTVSSATEAFTSAVELLPDALVSDLEISGVDGGSVLHQIREALGPRAPRVAVALVAFPEAGEHEKAVDSGFDRHVPKPFDPEALVRLLEDLLAPGH
jgi:signal transduction histidine kinase